MLWRMTGKTEVKENVFEKVDTLIFAESMCKAFAIAEQIYGPGITGAQRVEEKKEMTEEEALDLLIERITCPWHF